MAAGGSGRMHACAHQMPLSLIGLHLAARAPCRSASRRRLRRLRRPASGRGCRSQGLVWVCDASSGGEQSADVKQLRGARLNSAPGRRRQQAGSRRRGLGAEFRLRSHLHGTACTVRAESGRASAAWALGSRGVSFMGRVGSQAAPHPRQPAIHEPVLASDLRLAGPLKQLQSVAGRSFEGARFAARASACRCDRRARGASLRAPGAHSPTGRRRRCPWLVGSCRRRRLCCWSWGPGHQSYLAPNLPRRRQAQAA